MNAEQLLHGVRDGHRLNAEEALLLWTCAEPFALAQTAHQVRLKKAPADVITYVVDRNINYTNACTSGCTFCAYFRPPGHPEAERLSLDELGRKIDEAKALGASQILLQGGHNPDMGLADYEEMLAFIKAEHTIHVHGYSPPEVTWLADKEGLTVPEVLKRMQAAGLDSIPGGGAEILVDRVRSQVAPGKCATGPWLEVMRQAHELGMKTTATMMFGHIETPAERIEHLLAVRDLQDETGGFTAFIPWTFQPGDTPLGRRLRESGEWAKPTAVEYLRMVALCRLVLDNVPNIQASWVTMGATVAQMSLFHGANDFGSTMIEENVVAAAGVSHSLAEDDIRRLVTEAGFSPRRRLMDYSAAEGA